MSDRQPQENRRTKRRRWVLAVAATVAVFALALASLHTPWVRGVVAGWIEGRLAGMGIDAQIGSLSYGLFDLDGELRDVRLRVVVAGEPFLVAERLYVDLSWSALRGELVLQVLELEGAVVHLQRAPEGGWNLPPQDGAARDASEADTAAPTQLAIETVRIERTELRLQDVATGVGIVLPAVAFSASSLATGGRLGLELPGTLSLGDRSIAIEELGGGVAWDGSSLGLRSLTVAGTPGRLAIDGVIADLPSGPTWAVDFTAAADSAEVARFLGVGDGPTGSLEATGRVEGPLAAPTATLEVSSPRIGWSALELTDLSSEVTASPGALTVAALQAGIAGGRASGTGEGRYAGAGADLGPAVGRDTGTDLPGTVHLEVEAVDATTLAAAWPRDPSEAGSVPQLASLLDATLDASWTAWPGADLATLAATLDVTARQHAAPGLPVLGEARLTVESGLWTLQADPRLGDALRLDAALEGRLGSPLTDSTLRGTLVATAPDLSRLPPALAALAGTLPELAGSGSAELALEGTLSSPVYRGPLQLQHLRIGPAAAARLTGTVAGSDGRIDLEDLTLTAGAGEITGRAGADLASGQLDGRVRAVLPRLSALLPDAPAGTVPEGEVVVDGGLGGTLDAPRIDLTARGEALRLAGQPAIDAEARAVVTTRAVRLEELIARQQRRALERRDTSPQDVPQQTVRPQDRVAARADADQRDELAVCRSALPAGDPGAATVPAPGCFRLTATYDFETAELSFHAAGRALELVPVVMPGLDVPISGTVDLHADGGLAAAGLRGTATLAASNLDAYDRVLGSLEIEALGAGDAVELVAALPGLGTSLQGRLSRNGPYELRAELDELPLERLFVEPAADRRARLTAVVDAAGDLTADPISRASVWFQALNGSVAGVALRLLRPGTVELVNGALRTDGIEVGLGNATLRLEGSWPGENETLLANLAGDLADLEALLALAGANVSPGAAAPRNAVTPEDTAVSPQAAAPADAAVLADGLPLDLAGALEARIELAGAIGDPRATGRIVVRRGQVSLGDLPPFRELEVELLLEDGAITLQELATTWRDAPLTASGRLPLGVLEGVIDFPDAVGNLSRALGTASLEARVGPLTAHTLRPFLSAEAAEIAEGRVMVAASLTAGQLQVEALRGEIVLEEADITIAGARLAQRQPTRFELADRRVEVRELRWAGAGTELQITGSAPLLPDQPVSLQARGDIDLRVLQLLVLGAASNGTGALAVDLSGTLAEPVLDGGMDLQDAELRIPAAGLIFREARGHIALDGQTLAIEPLAGELNGGSFVLTGTIPTTDSAGGRIELRAVDVAVQPVDGLRSLIDADLVLDLAAGSPGLLSGTVTIARGSYRERMSQVGQILERVRGVGEIAAGSTDSATDDLRLDLRIVTADSVRVANNLADIALTTDLRLTGTVGAPGLTGRAEMIPGGEVFLLRNRFRIESGAIDFTGARAIEPAFDLTALTRVRDYQVTLRISGTAGETDIDLSSDPPLPESDVASLLLTGRTLGDAKAAQVTVAQEQLVGLLAAEFTGRLAESVGLDSVRLERGPVQESFRTYPSPIATETDPTQRLTVSKYLRPDLELVFSQELGRSGGMTWLAIYKIVRDLEVQALFDDDINRAFQFGQQLTFGGGETVARAAAGGEDDPRVEEVTLQGDSPLPGSELRNVLALKPGDRFDFFRWQNDREGLEQLHRDRGYFEARVVTTRRTATEGAPSVHLTYTVETGPRTRVEARGIELPNDLRSDLEEIWGRSVLDEFLLQEARGATRLHLAERGFVVPTVQTFIDAETTRGEKRLVLAVDPGPHADNRRVEATGNRRVSTERIRAVLDGLQPPETAWVRPAAGADALAGAYAREGMLAARVSIGEPRVEGNAAVLPVDVEEGLLYRVGEVTLAGVDAIPETDAADALGIASGDPYAAARVAAAVRALEAVYRARGYTGAEVILQTPGTDDAQPPPADNGEVDVPVTFRVDEGPVETVASIEIRGAELTHPRIIDAALELREGDPVDREVLARAPKRLYDTGAFRRVDIEVEPTGPAEDGRVPSRLIVTVGERPPYRFRYGLRVNSVAPLDETSSREYRLGASTDLTSDNLLGRTISAGVSGRYESDFRIGRLYVTTPRFFGLPLISSAFVDRSREDVTVEFFGLERADIVDISSLTLEQRFSLFERTQFAYSYSFERVHTFEKDADPDDPVSFPNTVDVSRLALSALRDSRDDPFDATEGWLHSAQLEYSATRLGSDVRFARFLTQQYHYQPVGRLTLASAVRFGVAAAFDGQELIPSERFFAGGGNSVRGYAEDSLGPSDFFGPTGGTALVELKQEVRFPIIWRFRGVGFVDAGNVFKAFGDISLGELAVGTGVGLRVDTPLALLRIDYGLALNRQPGAPRGRFFFSIGQAF